MKKVHRVILCAGFVISRYDKNRHFISERDLVRLYHVLPTDITMSYGRMRRELSDERIHREGWKILEPSYEGNYYDIHRYDDIEWVPMKI